MERRRTDSEEGTEDAQPSNICEEEKNEWAQCANQGARSKKTGHGEMRGGYAEVKKVILRRWPKNNKAEDGIRMRWLFTPKFRWI